MAEETETTEPVETPAQTEEEKAFELGVQAGTNDGVLSEAVESLKRRFTDAELRAMVYIFWFSDAMQSIRTRLSELEKRAEALETAYEESEKSDMVAGGDD